MTENVECPSVRESRMINGMSSSIGQSVPKTCWDTIGFPQGYSPNAAVLGRDHEYKKKSHGSDEKWAPCTIMLQGGLL